MSKASVYKQCVNCILDTNDDPEITFDEKGVCNHCNAYISKYINNAPRQEEKTRQLNAMIGKMKAAGKGKKYDSIMGLSGGVDSSYLAFVAKEAGLNPLLVHFDNGWNSELAVQNIENIIRKTGFDLFTYVVDWNEFKDLQLSYIKAGVLDWEVPTDHGFQACLYEQAYKHKIKYVLTGHNYQTEAILPNSMRWNKWDVANILDIQKRFGKYKLKSFPLMGFFRQSWYILVLKLERVNFLEYVGYDKMQAKEIIKKEFGWRDYGGKHYESIFTRFYQGYALKEKFGIDKRKAHISNLILSGQITRDEALKEIAKPPYDEQLLKEDFEYVAKKFDMTAEGFRALLAEPNKLHLDYKSYETGLYPRHMKFMKAIRPLTSLIKKILGKK
jgi:N-acetyl sugar amidotransferase